MATIIRSRREAIARAPATNVSCPILTRKRSYRPRRRSARRPAWPLRGSFGSPRMCGIAGAVDLGSDKQIQALSEAAASIVAQMGHRGPETEGVGRVAPGLLRA